MEMIFWAPLAFAAGAAAGYFLKKVPPPPPPPAPPPPYEHRLESYGVLWFVQLKLQEPYITDVLVGLPHCKKCVTPLKLQAGPPESWLCLECGQRCANTVADYQVMDAVKKQAVDEFCQRRKGWRLKA